MTEVLDAILLWEGLILATLGMDKGKCGYVGCISGWFWALRVAPRVTDGWVRVSGYRLSRWKWQRCFRCNLAMWWPQTKRKPHLEKCNFHWFSAIFSGLVAVSTLSLILMKKSLYHDYLFFYSFLLTLSIIPEGPHMNFYLRRSPLLSRAFPSRKYITIYSSFNLKIQHMTDIPARYLWNCA